jgi:hypothetical protein
MAKGVFQRMREIAGSLDLLERDLLRKRDQRDDNLDPLVVSRVRTPEQHGHAAGHPRRPDPLDELAEA